MLPENGDKLSERELKALTGLNLGQIKEAKKFLKENGLTKAYRGRGGYVSLIEDAKFPVEENTMTAGEKRAAARAESVAKQKEIEQRRSECDKVREYVASEIKEFDDIDVFWIQHDMFYAWVWDHGYAKGYKVFANEI